MTPNPHPDPSDTQHPLEAPDWRRAHSLALAGCVVLGLALRLGLLAAAPRHAYLWDHLDFMVWSAWSYRVGPTTIYNLPPDTLINTNLPSYISEEPLTTPYPSLNRCNYPPLSAYAFWIQGWLWQAAGAPEETHTIMPQVAEHLGLEGGTLTSPVANTFRTRCVNAVLPVLADFAMAVGVVLLVRALRRRPAGWSEVAAFALTVLGPPIVLNSSFWTQMDACLACLLVWCVCLLITRRDVWAGVCFGAALMLKPQAILLGPVLAFVFLARIFAPGGSLPRAARLWKAAAAAVITAAVIAAPHAWADRTHEDGGWLRWYRRAYVNPIQRQFAHTTLKAFNVWWLDYLAHAREESPLASDVPVIAGITKDRFGRVLLTAAILTAATVAAWRWRWSSMSIVAFAFLTTLAAFVFPTRVHERYVYYCLPFLVAAAVVYRLWLPALVALLIVGTFEMTWYLWLMPPQSPPDAAPQTPDAALWSLVLAALTLLSFAYTLTTPLIKHK